MGTQHTVLVVEDNDFVRMQIVTFLKEAGYETLEATDGNGGLDLMSNDISLAVVDVRMEPMGGFEFITMMQLHGYKIPVVLVTGDQDNTTLEKAGRLKVATVLMKPIQKDRLVSMVGRLIERGG
jgi:CheY-like chemotaxis protein